MPETFAGDDTFACSSFCGCADHSDLSNVIELWLANRSGRGGMVSLMEEACGWVLTVEFVCQNVGVCDNMCMSMEPLHGEVIAYWPFCGGKVGKQ